MISADLREVWKRLAIKDGDLIFVDESAVDMKSLEGLGEFFEVNAVVIPVRVPKGKTISDCIAHISRNEASAMQGCRE